jgi:mitochondrial chaperone BCS1
MPSLRRNMAMGYSGQLSLECFGRSLDPIKALLEEAQTHYLQKSFTTTTIYRANGPGWLPVVSRPSRAIDSVILEPEKKQALLTDMNEYLHPRTRRWYANRGIPYRRGYLFSGPPGTGKTSLSAALAGVFGVDIYVLSLLDPYINEDSLQRLFSSVPSRCIMLLEDVDAAGLNRANDPKLSKKLKTEDDQPDAGTAIPLSKMVRAQGLPPPPPTPKAGISLSGLLNAIDGVSSSEGRILIMTTNNPQDLDAALIRPGRVDQHVEFKLPHQPEMREMFLRMYRGLGEDKFATSTPSGVSSGEKVPSEEELSALATSFSTAFPEGRLSLASIQGYLLMHKRDPKAAVQDAAAWSERTLNEAAKDDTDSEEAPNVEEAKSGETGLQSN